ncbi:MAG: hypothetical protein HQL32_07935 [Planctomycetes bacterium]|nr:hypothetical protein [Planctomycetota bacterium]
MDLVIAIEGCTNSNYSHCGVVIKENGEYVVIESLGMVKITPLRDFLAQSRDEYYDVFRLKKKYQTQEILTKYRDNLKSYLFSPYDSRYRMDDLYIYCSELPYKAFLKTTGEKMGKLQSLGTMNWKPYEETIKKYENGPVPHERLMISPINLSKASQLIKVYSSSNTTKP